MRRNYPVTSFYRVRRGDNLGKIAEEQYGDSGLFPFIQEENHLKSPNLFFVGQKLKLPILKAEEQPKAPSVAVFRKPTRAAFRLPHAAYELNLTESVPGRTIEHPNATITMKLLGKLTFQKHGEVADFTIADLKQLEMEMKREVHSNVSTLVSSVGLHFDAAKGTIEVSGGLASEIKLPGGRKTYA